MIGGLNMSKVETSGSSNKDGRFISPVKSLTNINKSGLNDSNKASPRNVDEVISYNVASFNGSSVKRRNSYLASEKIPLSQAIKRIKDAEATIPITYNDFLKTEKETTSTSPSKEPYQRQRPRLSTVSPTKTSRELFSNIKGKKVVELDLEEDLSNIIIEEYEFEEDYMLSPTKSEKKDPQTHERRKGKSQTTFVNNKLQNDIKNMVNLLSEQEKKELKRTSPNKLIISPSKSNSLIKGFAQKEQTIIFLQSAWRGFWVRRYVKWFIRSFYNLKKFRYHILSFHSKVLKRKMEQFLTNLSAGQRFESERRYFIFKKLFSRYFKKNHHHDKLLVKKIFLLWKKQKLFLSQSNLPKSTTLQKLPDQHYPLKSLKSEINVTKNFLKQPSSSNSSSLTTELKKDSKSSNLAKYLEKELKKSTNNLSNLTQGESKKAKPSLDKSLSTKNTQVFSDKYKNNGFNHSNIISEVEENKKEEFHSKESTSTLSGNDKDPRINGKASLSTSTFTLNHKAKKKVCIPILELKQTLEVTLTLTGKKKPENSIVTLSGNTYVQYKKKPKLREQNVISHKFEPNIAIFQITVDSFEFIRKEKLSFTKLASESAGNSMILSSNCPYTSKITNLTLKLLFSNCKRLIQKTYFEGLNIFINRLKIKMKLRKPVNLILAAKSISLLLKSKRRRDFRVVLQKLNQWKTICMIFDHSRVSISSISCLNQSEVHNDIDCKEFNDQTLFHSVLTLQNFWRHYQFKKYVLEYVKTMN